MRAQILTVLAGMAGLVLSFNHTLRDSIRRGNLSASDLATNISISDTVGSLRSNPWVSNMSTSDVSDIIPVTDVTCSGTQLDPDDFVEVRNKMIEWGLQYKLSSRCMKFLTVGESTYFVCNCKWFHWDPLPREEIMEVERLLYDKCGPWQSGIVFSKKWKKAYEIQPKALWDTALKKEWPAQHVCPPSADSADTQLKSDVRKADPLLRPPHRVQLVRLNVQTISDLPQRHLELHELSHEPGHNLDLVQAGQRYLAAYVVQKVRLQQREQVQAWYIPLAALSRKVRHYEAFWHNRPERILGERFNFRARAGEVCSHCDQLFFRNAVCSCAVDQIRVLQPSLSHDRTDNLLGLADAVRRP
ncbi:hypothetical protein Hte_000473 [Hypoxylon texense]